MSNHLMKTIRVAATAALLAANVLALPAAQEEMAPAFRFSIHWIYALGLHR